MKPWDRLLDGAAITDFGFRTRCAIRALQDEASSVDERLAKLEAAQPSTPDAPWREVMAQLVEAVKAYSPIGWRDTRLPSLKEKSMSNADSLDAAESLLAAPVQPDDGLSRYEAGRLREAREENDALRERCKRLVGVARAGWAYYRQTGKVTMLHDALCALQPGDLEDTP